MLRSFHLPPPPDLRVEVVEDRSPPADGFLRRLSRVVRLVRPDGSRTTTLVYDEVDRIALDAVVVAPHFLAPDDTGKLVRFVVLRSAARPPVALRSAARSPMVERDNRGLWELPAGLIEPSECTSEGVVRCAARELEEETGFTVRLEDLKGLGPSTFPAPGMAAERHFFFEVEVSPQSQGVPSLDGSPLEEEGQLVAIPLTVALDAVRAGQVEDAKTEIGLRRLFEVRGAT